MFYLVRYDGRRLIAGDAGPIHGPFDHAAGRARHRPRRFFGVKQSRAHRPDHSAHRGSRIRQSTGNMDVLFGTGSDSPRAISMALASACGKVAANNRRR